MEIAVLSDIHGNYIALEQCLDFAKARGIDTYYFLGDYLGELAYPQRTMERLYQLAERHCCFFVRGNKEDYWIYHRGPGKDEWQIRNSVTGCLLYTYEMLTERDLDFFAQMPVALRVETASLPSVTLCHGSPFKVNDRLMQGDSKTFEMLERVKSQVILCGHTHVRGSIKAGGKCVYNPGSVGMPHESRGKAQFMILHGGSGNWTEEFISLEYDTERVIRELHESGVYDYAPYWCTITERILKGEQITHGTVLKQVMALCEERTGSCRWPDIPESCWPVILDRKMGENEELYQQI